MANFNPPKWGGETTSKDWEMFISGQTLIDEPISLIGHSLTGLTPETLDAVTIPVVEKIRGRIQNRIKTLRAAQVTGMTGTLGFGNALWTPAMQKARQAGSCEVTLYIDRLCPADSDERVTYFFPETVLAQPTRVNDPVTVDETNSVEWQSEFRAPNEYVLWTQGGYELTDLSDPLYALTTVTEECAGCDDTVYQRFVAVGGTNSLVAVKSEDRFGDFDYLTFTSAPASHVGTSVWSEGDVILMGFANTADYLTAATGGTYFSADGGVTAMSRDTNISAPVNGVARYAGQYLAVGGVGGGQAMVWTSTNGVDWTSVSSAALPANAALSAVSVDEENGVFYAVGENGLVLKGRLSGSSITLSALTPAAVTTQDLFTVKVLGDDHVAIGGASGAYDESLDGGDTWESPSFPGTNTVYAIAGSNDRVITQSAGVFYVRDVQTKNVFTSMTAQLKDGAAVTGNVRGLFNDNKDLLDRHNYFAAVTSGGEVYQFRPQYPNA